ncbi:MAG TPA: hypothetical protein VL860_03895 [Planctomycetota bacterium]|nr:hypothetical protein [Planctomycetota bacterium]
MADPIRPAEQPWTHVPFRETPPVSTPPVLTAKRFSNRPSKPWLWPLVLSSLVTGFNTYLLVTVLEFFNSWNFGSDWYPGGLVLIALILLGFTIVERVGDRFSRNLACTVVVLLNIPAALGYLLLLFVAGPIGLAFLAPTALAILLAINHASRMSDHELGGHRPPAPRAKSRPDDEFEITGAWDEAKPN